MSREMGRRHQRDVQKLHQSRVCVLFNGVLRATCAETAVHVDQNSQFLRHSVERNGPPPQRDDQ